MGLTAFGPIRPAQVLLALAIVGAFGILIALGTWQLQRLAWKEALIDAASARPEAAAVAAPGPEAWPLDLEDWNYRRIALTGTFGEGEAHAYIVLSAPKGTLGGPGYFVLAPFTTEDGWHAVVNRGFVPAVRKEAVSRPDAAPPTGPVTVKGIVRRDDPPNFVTPDPDLAGNAWYSRDVSAIAAALGLPADATAPFNIDLVAQETPPGGLPQAGESRVAFTNNHLQYALTWYGIAAALLGVSATALWRAMRRRKSSTAPGAG